MSHKCGPNCLRRQDPPDRCGTCRGWLERKHRAEGRGEGQLTTIHRHRPFKGAKITSAQAMALRIKEQEQILRKVKQSQVPLLKNDIDPLRQGEWLATVSPLVATLLRQCEGWPDGRQRLIQYMGEQLMEHPDLTVDDFVKAAAYFAGSGERPPVDNPDA